MREPLASTKFLAPPVPRCYVPRPRLHEALNRGAGVPLTTVVGPPGCGKTVAVASWLTRRPQGQTMWMSCDERDSQPVTFWRSLTEGLQRLWPDSWLDVRDLLDEDRPSLRDVAVAAANELDALGEPVTIVIDDFHVAREANASVALAIEALPRSTRLVLVSRADPALPLHRMRVQHELLELREQDLRLSPGETTALADALGLELDGEACRLLHERTDGWMAAVHLAAISLRGRDDAHEFLQMFSGESRLMAEFLLGEVLSRQPPHLRRFLEDSSVLDELDGPACRAVTGVAESADLLRDLSVENMLVAPRGDGLSYRYHQLFRDLLQYRLRANSPERFTALHKIAAEWYEARGEYDRAAAHLTTTGDDHAAYALLRDHAVDVLVTGGPAALDRLVSVLDLKRAVDEPGRAIDVAVALAVAGALDEATRWIKRVEQAGTELSTTEASRLAGARAVVAILQGDPEACETALRDVSTTSARDPIVDAIPTVALHARLWLDDPSGARAVYEAAAERGHATLEIAEVMLPAALAWAMCVEGSLREAEVLSDDTLARAERYGELNHPMTFGALWARGRVLYERGRFDEAESAFERAITISERTRPPFALLGAGALARLWIAEGRYIEAAVALEHARSCLPAGSTSPLLDLVTACEAQLALATGDVDRADALARTLHPSGRRSHLEATIALARGNPTGALAALEAPRPATLRRRLDTSVLRARALHTLGGADADAALEESLALARPEGFVVALTDDMPDLGPRVSFHLRSRPIGAFERAVLDRLDHPRSSAGPNASPDLVEQLSAREHTVLRYLDSRLTLNEIASECYISTNTVKTHTKAVYRKLGVSSRRDAITEGRRLQLL